MPCLQRRIAVRDGDQLEVEAVVIGEAKRVLRRALARVALAAEPLGPEVDRLRRWNPQLDQMDVPDPRPPRSRARELEPREDRTRRAGLVAEVEVVRLGLIEVD